GAPQEVLVLSVTFNERGNGILTLREGCLAHQLLVFRDTVRKAFKTLNSEVLSVEADQQWSKYKLHGVSTEQFGGEKGMEELKAEIETYNPRIKLAMAPRWLTRPEAREGKKFSSVVITIDDQESKKLMKRGLYVLGVNRKTEQYFTSRPTDQCGQCLNFGHHWRQCTTKPRCKFCASAHLTKDHVCKDCGLKGKNCGHGPLKCCNCGKGHLATDPKCEIIVAARGKKATTAVPVDLEGDVVISTPATQQQQ